MDLGNRVVWARWGDHLEAKNLIHVAGLPQIYVAFEDPEAAVAGSGVFRRVALGSPWQWEVVDGYTAPPWSTAGGELRHENGVCSVCTNSFVYGTYLKYGVSSGASWSVNPVFTLNPNPWDYAGYQCTIANGAPAIAYVGHGGELAVAKRGFLFWSKEVLAAHGESPKIVRAGAESSWLPIRKPMAPFGSRGSSKRVGQTPAGYSSSTP